ncbi:SusC/RagA family TonB-linked outer membrane protein [Maribacter sp. 2-571]|uniref:SusC/RagA family TonB-linked outer membrane protein n=1 Tax=Maribacter sp. 2-571 TaxID=3417569 RepID=UPI003D3257DA
MKSPKKYLFLVLLTLPIAVFSQLKVSGTVTDNLGEPLPGVNVVVKGTATGTTSDFDGLYEITTNEGDILQFSYLGFKTKEVTVSSATQLDVVLEEDSQLLEEVVVIGYGTTTVKDATGSLTAVSVEDFNKGAIVSTDQLLTGKAAGVRITSAGGAPDSAPNIRIRGGSSLTAQNNPLIVIDGVPIDNTNPAGVNNPFSLINPNDVESFSILKDASATAIYGSRASNGVIIITTKKGTSGAPKFNFSTNTSISNVGQKIDLMDGPTFVRFINEFHPNETDLLGIENPNGGNRLLSDTDWQDAIYRTAVSYDVNFSARANLFDKVPARLSLGYNETEGLVKTNDYERFTGSIKLTPMLFDDHLKIDVNAKGIRSEKNAIDEGGALGGAVSMDPTKPIFDNSSDNRFGGFYQLTNPNGSLDGQSNPLALLLQRKRPEKVEKILGNIEFDYKMHFLPELRAVLNLGLEASSADIEEVFSDNSLATYRLSSETDEFIFNPGVNYRENQSILNQTLDAYLVYAKSFDKGIVSRFDVQGGYAYQNFRNEGDKEEYTYESVEDGPTGNRKLVFDPLNPNNYYFSELNLQSFFGRTNINFAEKYQLTLSFRADGSSLFNPDDRWGYFPAAAVAWQIQDEPFLKDVSFVNKLKLRLGWGQTGQQDITGAVGFYPSTPLYEPGSVTSQYLPGTNLYSAKAFNENLTWEKTVTYNAGLDFGFFEKHFINGSFDVFYRETSDLLAQVPVAPGQALTDSFVDNVGETESKGFELSLNAGLVQTEHSNFEIYTNLAYSEAEVTSLEDVTRITATESTLPNGTGRFLARHTVGFQPYSAWVFRQLYDDLGNPVHGAFADFDGDGEITSDDRYFRALRPNWTFGFGFNFNYKNLDFSSSFRGQLGGEVYNARKLTSGWIDRPLPVNANNLSNVLDFYNGSADFNLVDVIGDIPFSDYFLEDASFIRCENIVLGYKIQDVFKNASLRLYGVINNPFLITKYDGQDPENFNAIDNNFYPRPRSLTFGLNLDF